MDVLHSAAAKNSWLGRVNAATKIVVVAVLSVAFLLSADWVTSAVAFACLLLALVPTRINPVALFLRIWPILVGVLLSAWSTALLAEKTGPVVLDLGLTRLTTGSVADGAAIGVRGLALAMISVLLFLTTDASEIGQALAQTFRFPVRFVLAAVAAFRLVGILFAEWHTLAAARRARGLGGGRGPVGALRSMGGQSFALLVQALRRATRLATTMEARGFGAGPRTWLHRPVFGRDDVLVLVLGLAIPVLAIGVSLAAGTYRMIF